jgi:hypothetical protein
MRTTFLALFGSVTVASALACSNTVATRTGDNDVGSAEAGGSSDTTGGASGSPGGAGASGSNGAGGASNGAGGSAGGAGMAGIAGAGGSGGGMMGCAGLPLCDDFESAAADGPPSTTKWKVGAPNGTGSGKVTVDGTQAHSGTKSVRVNGTAGYSNHIFFYNESNVAGIGKLVFGRMFVRFSQGLADGHATFMTMKDTGDMKDLRMGGQMKILMYNRELNDATLPALSPVGIAKSLSPVPSTWLCIEFKIDGNTGEIQTWVDGSEIAGLHADGTPTQDIDQQWASSGAYKPSLADVKFGWESYAGGDMTLWFDDVALAPQRIGCN